MKIRTVRHRGLKRPIEEDDDRGLRRDLVSRVRRILTVLLSAESNEEIAGPPGWRIHQLTGDRADTWNILGLGQLADHLSDKRRRYPSS